MDWQPISTAPKDGTHILLWWHTCSKASVGAWSVDEESSRPVEGWRCEGDRVLPKNQHDAKFWMPLPAPPKTANESTS